VTHQREALEIARRVGDPWVRLGPLINLGRALVAVQQCDVAKTHLHEAGELARELGDQVLESAALQTLGMAAMAEGSLGSAARHLEESLGLGESVGERVVAATTLEASAGLLAATDPSRAARVLGAVEAHRQDHGAVREGVDQPAYERAVDVARAALGEASFAAAWADGRALRIEEAIAEARAALSAIAE
jgi:hypothetical protein